MVEHRPRDAPANARSAFRVGQRLLRNQLELRNQYLRGLGELLQINAAMETKLGAQNTTIDSMRAVRAVLLPFVCSSSSESSSEPWWSGLGMLCFGL
eukprot:SAG11_NODE_5315_length_1599_cov_0.970000_3_plen_97_part_00